MDDQPRRLVEDDQVGVLVEDLERDLLRPRLQLDPLRPLVLQQVAFPDRFRGPRPAAVQRDQAGARQAPGRGAAERGIQLGEDSVEPAGGSRYPDCQPLWRRTYPSRSRTTPTQMAESATLKTGQKWRAMKSVTLPCRRRS